MESDFEDRASGGDCARLIEYPAADRIDAVRRQVDAQIVAKVAERYLAIEEVAAVAEVADLRDRLLELVVDVADDLFQDIFQSGDAGGAAVLIEDDRHVDF